jgi:hypothetical protein
MINIVFNTSRRIDLFYKTLTSLIEKNPEIQNLVEHVYILDHLSSYSDRKKMVDLCRVFFEQEVTLYEFNGVDDFDYVDKLNSIRRIVEREDIIIFLEDDWECISPINFEKHIEIIKQREFDIISFSSPLHIQDENIINNFKLDEIYWKNPFPEFFKSPFKMENGFIIYNIVRMNNFGLTPHMALGEMYFDKNFDKNQNYEVNFADNNNLKQLFTNEMHFTHIGFKKTLETHK